MNNYNVLITYQLINKNIKQKLKINFIFVMQNYILNNLFL